MIVFDMKSVHQDKTELGHLKLFHYAKQKINHTGHAGRVFNSSSVILMPPPFKQIFLVILGEM